MAETSADFSARLERLERENRRLKLGGALVAAVTAATLLMGQAAPQGAVTAQERFTLKDVHGKTRLQMDADPEGPARLVMFDAEGVQRAVLKVTADGGTTLGLVQKSGQPGAQLECWPDGRAGLSCENSGTAKLAVSADGTAFFVVRDKKGNQLFRAPQ